MALAKDLHIHLLKYSIIGDDSLKAEDSTSIEAAKEFNYNEEVDYALKALKEKNVYASDSSVEYLWNYDGGDIAIIEIPQSFVEKTGTSLQHLSEDTLSKSQGQYDLVLSYISGTKEFAAAAEDPALAKNAEAIVYKGLDGKSSLEFQLFSEQDELQTLVSTTSEPPSDNRTNPLAVVGLTGVASIPVAFAVAMAVAANKRNNKRTLTVTEEELPLPELEGKLRTFAKLQDSHSKAGTEATSEMKTFTGRVNELFQRIDRRGNLQQRKLAEVEYMDIIDTLTRALGEDYYMDIANNPTLWDNPEQRKAEVLKALKLANRMAIENIKQVNAARDLEFKSSLATINNSASRYGDGVEAMLG